MRCGRDKIELTESVKQTQNKYERDKYENEPENSDGTQKGRRR